MKLLVIILCLLSERFLIHSVSYQRFVWFDSYCASIKKIADRNNHINQPALMLAFIVLPIVLLVWLVYLLACSAFWGFPGFLAQIVLFYYCLGPQNAFYPIGDTNIESSHTLLISSYLAKVNNQLFAIIFWYVVAGPIAALIFRLVSLAQTDNQAGTLAIRLTELLEWAPARITALLYLLVGNFQAGFKQFTAFLGGSPETNNAMLSECGLLAMRTNSNEEESIPAAEQLVEHALVVLLVLVALCTLVAWL